MIIYISESEQDVTYRNATWVFNQPNFNMKVHPNELPKRAMAATKKFEKLYLSFQRTSL